MTGNTENPIDQDDRLQELLANIGDVTSRKAYGSWRKEFLDLYTEALDDNGILNGKDGNYRLIKQLQQLEHRTRLVIDGPIKNGSISNSTNGRRLLTNLTQEVARTETKVQELLPKTEADVEKFGFDKFELAAVLLEDGFYGYDKMKASRATLDAIANALAEESSSEFRSELQILHKYSDAVESFVRVMEDLRLINIMDQCVDVVYRGKERPTPKPPPVPSTSDEEEDEEEEPSHESDPKPKKSKKKKKKKDDGNPAGTSSDDDEEDENDGKKKKKKKKKEKSGKPSATKKKKKPKKAGGGGDASTDDDTVDSADDDEDDAPKSKKKAAKRSSLSSGADKPKSSKPKPKQGAASSSDDDDGDSTDDDGRDRPERDEEEEESSEEEEEDEEGEDGPPPESEFLLYFDPKTNSIGRIDRKEAINKSNQLVETKGDDGHGGPENYKNTITDQDEKDEVWFMLKKLERQKPEEESWLDRIKKEKAAAKGNNSDAKKKVNKSTAMISKRRNSTNGGSSNTMMSPNKAKNNNKGLGVGTTMIGSGGNYRSPLPGNEGKKVDVEKLTFRNPLAEGPGSPTPRKPASSRSSNRGPLGSPVPRKRDPNEDYGAKYKEIADKPDADGWSKVSSRALQ